MKKQLLIRLFKVCLSLSLISFLFYRIDIVKLFCTLYSANIYYVLLAFSLVIGGVIISSYKWHILLGALDVDIPFIRLVSFYFRGMFFNNFLPSSIGGDAVRIYTVSKQSKKAVESLTSVFMERMSGLLALILIAIIASIVGYKGGMDCNIVFMVLVISIGFLIILSVIFSKNLFEKLNSVFALMRFHYFRSKLEEIRNCLYVYNKKTLLKAFAISAVFQVVSVVMAIYVVSLSLNLKVPLSYFFLVVPLIALFAMLPISLNGIGVREGAFVFFFAKAGLSDVQALSMSLLAYAIVLVAGLIGGVIYLAKRE